MSRSFEFGGEDAERDIVVCLLSKRFEVEPWDLLISICVLIAIWNFYRDSANSSRDIVP